MKTVRVTIDPAVPTSLELGRIDAERVDATTDAEIATQHAADETQALLDAEEFTPRVRRRLGLSQAEFSERIDVPIDTIRNWEQGKRSPTGAAKALLKVLDRAPGSVQQPRDGSSVSLVVSLWGDQGAGVWP